MPASASILKQNDAAADDILVMCCLNLDSMLIIYRILLDFLNFAIRFCGTVQKKCVEC